MLLTTVREPMEDKMTNEGQEIVTETVPETKVNAEPVADEGNDMLASLQGWMNKAKEYTGLLRRVKELEAAVSRLTEDLKNTTAERDSLHAENANIKDELRAVKDDRDYKADAYERQRKSTQEWMRRYDEEKVVLDKVRDELEGTKDERDLATLEVADWKRKHEVTEGELNTTREQFSEARENWFTQENQLTEKIDKLTFAKEQMQETIDRWTSMAATIMQTNQRLQATLQ